MGREEDIRNLEAMFGIGCCDCLDKGRPRLSPHPLNVLNRRNAIESGKPTGYIEMDLKTGEITTGCYRNRS